MNEPCIITIEALQKAMERGECAGYVEIRAEDCLPVSVEIGGARMVLGREPTVADVFGVQVSEGPKWEVTDTMDLDGVPHAVLKIIDPTL